MNTVGISYGRREAQRAARRAFLRCTFLRCSCLSAICVIMAAPGMLAQPVARMHVTDLADQGVHLVGPEDPAFSRFVDTALRGLEQVHGGNPKQEVNLGLIEPLTVVLRNETPKAIVAYSVVWAGTDAMGHAQREPRFHMQPYALMHGDKPGYDAKLRGGVLPPNGAKIVTPFGAFDEHMSMSMSASDADTAEFVAGFQGSRIEAQLDAVIFEDGSVIGPDTTHLMESFAAYLAAKRDVLGYLLEPTHMASEMSSRFERLIDDIPAWIHSGGSTEFHEQYKAWKSQFAEELRTVQRVAGDDAVRNYVYREYPRYVGVPPLRRLN